MQPRYNTAMGRIAIVGLGLIGGSLGLALKKIEGQELHFEVLGIPRREETLKTALEMQAIDEGTLEIARVASADIVFIATPINLILPKLQEIVPHLKSGAIVTDVGSTKGEIVSAAEKMMPKNTYFVGGHPMAGKEVVGIEAAEASLFQDKTWILTKTSKTRKEPLEVLKRIIVKIGAKVLELDPKTHDRVVAAISHVPLAAAASLVNIVADDEEKELMMKCASSGFRDTTRVASGSPVMGVDMFKTNRVAILKLLKDFRAEILELEKLIKSGDEEKIQARLIKAKSLRDEKFASS